jgi:PAS domain S-box-containing protein
MFLESETNLTLAFGLAAAFFLATTLLFLVLLTRTAARLGKANAQLSQTERGADHTERRMFNILNSIPVALVETDTSGRFVFANKAAHTLLGRKDAELIGLRFHSATWGITYPDGRIIPPDLLPAARALRGQTVKGFQHLIVNPNTRKRILVSVTAMPVTNELGEIIGSTAAMAESEAVVDQLPAEAGAAETPAAESLAVDPLARIWPDLADDVLLALDAEGRVRELNRRGVELLGGEALGRNWFDGFVVEADQAAAKARFQTWVDGTAPVESGDVERIVGADGEIRALTWRREPVRDKAGRLIALACCGRELVEASHGESPRAEASPAQGVESETLLPYGLVAANEEGPAPVDPPSIRGLRGFAESADDILWAADAQTGQLTFVSKGFQATYGFDLEALQSDLAPWMARVHPDDRAAVQAAHVAAKAGEHSEVEFRFETGDGETLVLHDRVFPILADDGTVESLGGVARDITAQRRAERALRDSAARFQAMVETAPQLVWSAAADGGYDYVSPGWTAYTGLAEAQHHGLGWQDAVHPEDRVRVAAAWTASVRGEQPFDIDYRLRAAHGGYRWFRARSAPQRDAEGRITSWLGAAIDVTEIVEARAGLEQSVADRTAELALSQDERRKTETALAQAQRLETVGRLTGGVAHDFNNLLTVILGALDMIQRHADKPERIRRLGEAAMAAGRRGERLTRQLLAFSRRQEFQLETLDIAELIRGFEPLVRRALGEAVPFEVDAPDGLGAVRLDPVQFEAALLNLIVNAKDAVETGGSVSLSARRLVLEPDAFPDLEGGDYLEVAVVDTGVGMEAEVVSRALEPFFTTKEIGRGTGLGLAQVYGFARQSGGHVRIESRPGQGTKVSLYLPAAEALADGSDADGEAEARPLERGKTVLLVEDDTGVRAVAETLLVELGCSVVTAGDGPHALRVLERSPEVDLLLTDMIMPGGMSGVELAQTALLTNPELKVLLSTGYADESREGVAEHGWSVLRKPYQAEELSEAVRAALA